MRARFKTPLFRFLIIFLILLLVRVPFYFTHHLQEDAYISLRCAENLATSGVYGFNPGERVSSSTAHLYVFLAALIRVVSGHAAFIPVMQIVNALLFLMGTFFIARVLGRGEKQQLMLWAFISILPLALLMSYSGMETSLLVFLVGLSLYFYQRHKPGWTGWLALGLLPWVRPDAVAYPLLVVFWYSVRERRLDWQGLTAIVVGTSSLLIFNQVYFGTLLQQSINAKLLMRHSFSWSELLRNVRNVFIGQADGGIFSPIRTRFFNGFGTLFLVIIVASLAFYLWQSRAERKALLAGFTIGSMVLFIPLAFAIGGVLYQWYFWPSAFLGYALIMAVVARFSENLQRYKWLIRSVIFLVLAAGMLAQLAFSYSWGMKEYAYRGGIGVWLEQHASEDDRIFLEPAGYIPYYSGLYTYDEVGLVTPQVVKYRQVYDLRWWPEFLMDYQPQWIIQRAHILDDTTYQGYRLTAEESKWFHKHYTLAASFKFRPEDYTNSPLLVRLLALGSVDDYYVFLRVK